MDSDQWSFWLLAWARGHFPRSRNEVVKQLSMNACPTSINSTHTAQQPNTTAQVVCSREYREGTLISPSPPRVWSHKKAKPPRSPACDTYRVLVWLEGGIWNPALPHSPGTSRSSLAGAGFCLTHSPKAFPGFVVSWPLLLLLCPQPGQSDGGGKTWTHSC